MPTYSLINNGESGASVRATLNSLIGDVNNGVLIGPTGPAGSSGQSGTSGSSGTSGNNGSSGTSGNNGTSGSSGTSGNTGASGTSGSSGTSGNTGASGTSGSSGTSGNTGTSGTSPFPADFFETYIDPTGTTASLLTTTSSWVNNLIGPTGISGTLAGMRHYDTTVGYVYEAVKDNVWLRYNIVDKPSPFITLTDAATVSWNITTGYNAKLTLTGQNRDLQITGATSGDYGTIIITQDSLTASIVNLIGKFADGTYSFSGTGSTDIFNFVYDGSSFYWNFNKKFI